MWKLFVFLAAVAGFRLWNLDHGVLATLAALAAVISFWSAGVMDNFARASRNYYGAPKTRMEEMAIVVNMVASLTGLGLFALSFFLK